VPGEVGESFSSKGVCPVEKKVGDIMLAYEEAGAGFPVVLLHAFPLNKAMWDFQRRELSRDYRIITPDFRGHGESAVAAGDSTLEALAEDVHGLLAELGIERCLLGGLSMGGYASFAFYRKYREQVVALILADTRAQADTAEGRQERARLVAVAEAEGAAGVAAQLLPKLLGATTRASRPEIVACVRGLIHSTPVPGIVKALRGMAARPDSRPLLPEITCSALILVGEEDTLTPPADSEAIAQAIPHAQLQVIAQAGHLSNLEQPAAFTNHVRSFLAQVLASQT